MNKKGAIPPILLVFAIIVFFYILDQSSPKYMEIDLSNFGTCSNINITVNSDTIVGWTNSGLRYTTYYMTLNNNNEIVEIKPNFVYKVKYTGKGSASIRCGTDRYNLQEGRVNIKNWWE